MNREKTPAPFDVTELRQQFPALSQRRDGQVCVYFDGAAGTQVPHRVVDAVCRYLIETNANHGGVFATAGRATPSWKQHADCWPSFSARRIRTRSFLGPT